MEKVQLKAHNYKIRENFFNKTPKVQPANENINKFGNSQLNHYCSTKDTKENKKIFTIPKMNKRAFNYLCN